jgi:hypothetical protein
MGISCGEALLSFSRSLPRPDRRFFFLATAKNNR